MRYHVSEVIAIEIIGGRFFPRTESDIPLMPAEKAFFYLRMLKEKCGRG